MRTSTIRNLTVLLASGAMLLPFSFGQADAATASPKCDGKVATIVANPYQNEIHGTTGDDVIFGTQSDDEIYGYGGNDVICGHGGNDFVASGHGNDTVLGGLGDDTLWGGNDDDRLIGEEGFENYNGGLGFDTCDAPGPYETMRNCEKDQYQKPL